jgi:hypothetical protein
MLAEDLASCLQDLRAAEFGDDLLFGPQTIPVSSVY